MKTLIYKLKNDNEPKVIENVDSFKDPAMDNASCIQVNYFINEAKIEERFSAHNLSWYFLVRDDASNYVDMSNIDSIYSAIRAGAVVTHLKTVWYSSEPKNRFFLEVIAQGPRFALDSMLPSDEPDPYVREVIKAGLPLLNEISLPGLGTLVINLDNVDIFRVYQ